MGVSKVILFGRGNVYHRKKKYMFENYKVSAFLDNSVEDQTIDEETGIEVFNPRHIIRFDNEEIILLSYSLGAMVKQLAGYGVDPHRIILGPQIGNYNTFEKALFADGAGRLKICGLDVVYQNSDARLEEVTDDSDIEKLVNIIKETHLYQRSDALTQVLPISPFDDTYGFSRGTPVDRYYIERFLSGHKELIKGTLLEVGDNYYSLKYGGTNIDRSLVLNIDAKDSEESSVRGNLETGEGIPKELVDCFICTQTMQFIYDIKSVVSNIVKVIKPGGVALVTVGGISQIIEYERRRFGHYWNFTDMSIRRLFEGCSDVETVDVEVYGNVKTATAFLYGLSYDELSADDLDYQDTNYQVIIGAVVKKRQQR